MSKPNVINVGIALDTHTNAKIRALRAYLLREIPIKIDFAELANDLFVALLQYAGSNQIDGDFGKNPRYKEAAAKHDIFAAAFLPVTEAQAVKIWAGFEKFELLKESKVGSWGKFNNHLAKHDQRKKQQEDAGRKSAKLRAEREAAAAEAAKQNGKASQPKASNQTELKLTPTQEISLLDKAIEEARDPAAKKFLKERRKKILGDATGTELNSKPSKQAATAQPARTEADDETILFGARYLVSIGKESMLTASQREALGKANPLPA